MRVSNRHPIRSGLLYVLALASAALAALPARAQRLVDADKPAIPAVQLPAPFFYGSGAIVDFDGDHRADFAVAQSQTLHGRTQSYRVDVHLSAHPSSAFDVESHAPGGLHVAALDVDGDHDLDLVITTEFGQEPVGVWINDGQGAFSQGDPAAYPAFIWQPGKHFFETPERPVAPPVVFSCPASGWAVDHTDRALPIPLSTLASIPLIERPSPAFVNPSSPFRAPPLF
jgi:hypothetical protein